MTVELCRSLKRVLMLTSFPRPFLEASASMDPSSISGGVSTPLLDGVGPFDDNLLLTMDANFLDFVLNQRRDMVGIKER